MNIKDSYEDLLGQWFNLEDEKRALIKKVALTSAVIFAIVFAYYGSGADEKTDVPTKEEKTEITIEATEDMLADDIRESVAGDVEKQKEEIKEVVKDEVQLAVSGIISSGVVGDDVQDTEIEAPKYPTPPTQPEPSYPETTEINYPPATGEGSGYRSPDMYDGSNGYVDDNGQPVSPWVISGGVKSSPRNATSLPLDQDNEKKEPKNTITVPVGFMKAKLLVGVTAMSGEFGQNNPQQITLRVQAPAQLPNSIKMQLKGCFSIANTFGNLATERINVLPVSMNCVTMDGKKMISGNIEGYVTDTNSMRDLKARVVAKSGSLLARALFATTVDSFGKAVAKSGSNTLETVIGTVSQTSKSDALRGAAAESFGKGTQQLSEYLLELAKQSAPVLEHGAGKTVYLYLVKPATLEIKEL